MRPRNGLKDREKSHTISFHFRGKEALILVMNLEPEHPAVLTPAEGEVFRLLCSGLAAVEIARTRGTTVRTVDKQTNAVYRKLEVSSRTELIKRYASQIHEQVQEQEGDRNS